MSLVHQLLYISIITPDSVIGQCNRTAEAANHGKSTQQNPLITELIIITIETTTYPGKKMGNSNFFALDIFPAGDICPKCIWFL